MDVLNWNRLTSWGFTKHQCKSVKWSQALIGRHLRNPRTMSLVVTSGYLIGESELCRGWGQELLSHRDYLGSVPAVL